MNGVLFYASGTVPVETYVTVYMENGLIVMKTYLGSGEPIVISSSKALNDNM